MRFFRVNNLFCYFNGNIFPFKNNILVLVPNIKFRSVNQTLLGDRNNLQTGPTLEQVERVLTTARLLIGRAQEGRELAGKKEKQDFEF